jgi:hypothetical protein
VRTARARSTSTRALLLAALFCFGLLFLSWRYFCL